MHFPELYILSVTFKNIQTLLAFFLIYNFVTIISINIADVEENSF